LVGFLAVEDPTPISTCPRRLITGGDQNRFSARISFRIRRMIGVMLSGLIAFLAMVGFALLARLLSFG